jgi:LPS sulfotransferase NodH
MANGFVAPNLWKSPDKTLIVASSPRSGSSYFCRLLDTTGLTRLTEEYFEEKVYRDRGLVCPTVAEKMVQIDRLSRTDSNLISIKLFPYHMTTVLDHGLIENAFRNPHYVFLRRDDLLGQAISFARATMTDKWTSQKEGREVEPVYKEAAILSAIRRLARLDAWWETFFATRDVPLLRLSYEGAEADPVGSMAAAVGFFGFDPKMYSADPAKVAISRQRDAVSEEWRARFLASEHVLGEPSDGSRARTLRNFWRFLNGNL